MTGKSKDTLQSLPITLCSVKVWNTCKEKRNTDITIQRLSTSTLLTMTLVTASLPTTVSTGQLSCALTWQFTHCHIDYNVFMVGIIQCQSHCDHLLILNNTVSRSVQWDCHHSYNVKWSTRKMKPSAVDKVHIHSLYIVWKTELTIYNTSITINTWVHIHLQ